MFGVCVVTSLVQQGVAVILIEFSCYKKWGHHVGCNCKHKIGGVVVEARGCSKTRLIYAEAHF